MCALRPPQLGLGLASPEAGRTLEIRLAVPASLVAGPSVPGPGPRLSQPVFLHLSKVRASVCLSVMLSSCLWAALTLLIPGGTSDKEPACQCRRHKRLEFDPCVGEDPLEEEMATHCSILACKIPWTEEPSRL